jgi:energy-coupling factor transporter ATP-binding protein EcfA2
MMSYKLMFKYVSKKNADVEKLQLLITSLANRSLMANWSTRTAKIIPQTTNEGNVCICTVTFAKKSGHLSAAESQWPKIQDKIIHYLQSPKFNGWQLLSEDGQILAENNAMAPANKAEETRNYFMEVNLEKGNNFDHIYDREAQILLTHSAIEAAIKTDLKKRFNCVLYGPPGCGKSQILLSIGKMLGKEGEAYLKFDATSTTEAGAQRLLLESDWIPPVLIVEEIEKANENSLRWLLGLCDDRGEVRKTNYRIGHNAKEVKMLVLATVNNMTLFDNLLAGALSSRFPNKIYCERPNRDVMKQILEREVKSVEGNESWIEPTLNFCMDELGWNDPRKLIPVCLQGRDRLLDGSYQAAIRKILPPK